ncbi:MAG: iron ABC transporter permease [Acidimicrobiia bacterium]|nr:iron ABC transporter permease [Acidimicrobiia bacterium]
MRPALLVAGLGVALAGVTVVALGSGAVRIAPGDVVSILLHHAGIGDGGGAGDTSDAVLWSIRLPRVVLGVAVGAGLAVAGAALQGIFRNPLADPQLIGISSGAAAGSAIGVLALESAIGGIAGSIGAFAGGLAAGAAVYSLARHRGRTEVVTLVLAGIAVAAVGGALAGFLSVIADDPRLGSPLFYSLGGLGVATWRLVGLTVPFIAIGVLALPRFARRLDLILLGEREAAHLGVDVEQLRRRVLVLVTIVVGASVAAAGVIGFVGLLVPHAVRLVAGPGHRIVLPASALGGAVLVVAADTVARTVALPLEVPVGLLTALAGGPLFLWLLRRTRSEHGGWG